MADIKLLLVEDDENLAYMEKSSFEDIIGGYEVKTAINGKDGLELWKHFQPDVIVSDIDMPIMDGIEMVKKIREIDGDTNTSSMPTTPPSRIKRTAPRRCSPPVRQRYWSCWLSTRTTWCAVKPY